MSITRQSICAITRSARVRSITGCVLLGVCLSVWLATPAVSQPPRAAERNAAEKNAAEKNAAEAERRLLQQRERAERERLDRRREEPDAQPRRERPGELPHVDELVRMALDQSIERRLAVLRIEQAQLELKRVEREITLHTAELHRTILLSETTHRQTREGIELAEQRLRRYREMAERDPSLRDAISAAEQELSAMHLQQLEAETRREQARMQLQLLIHPLREQDDRERRQVEREADERFRHQVLERIPDEVRRALAANVAIQFIDTPLSDAMAFLQDLRRVKIVVDTGERGDFGNRAINLELPEASLSAALQAIADTNEGVHIYLRDYGILVSPNPHKDGLRLSEFLEIAR